MKDLKTKNTQVKGQNLKVKIKKPARLTPFLIFTFEF